jgi:ABC-2 type transport system ATP-binding protein
LRSYEVLFWGETENLKKALNSHVIVQEEPTRGDVKHLIIKKNQSESLRSMIASINEAVEIVSFDEMIPGMNDIFIRAVEETNQKNKI